MLHFHTKLHHMARRAHAHSATTSEQASAIVKEAQDVLRSIHDHGPTAAKITLLQCAKRELLSLTD